MIKNIPESINKLLNELSSSKDIFDQAKPEYEKALKDSGYNVTLEYSDNKSNNRKQKPRQRHRNCLWFNPPFSQNVETDIGRKFLKLLDSKFENNPLKKIFNRNWIKMSYETSQNLASIIAAHNSKVIREYENAKKKERECNCRVSSECPMNGKCLQNNIIYQAKVSTQNKNEYYVGLTSNSFKTRLATHKASLKKRNLEKSCKLAQYVWELKDKNINYNLTWKTIGKAKPFSSINNICNLCNLEKYFILFKPEMATINKRTELTGNSRHKSSILLDKG